MAFVYPNAMAGASCETLNRTGANWRREVPTGLFRTRSASTVNSIAQRNHWGRTGSSEFIQEDAIMNRSWRFPGISSLVLALALWVSCPAQLHAQTVSTGAMRAQ